ncbi:MAG: uridine phosphorylase [Candidatus Nanopelagicales bacterium]|nr:uridine phosphorylase [Candidatus Nanopelagicales bacterium]MCF8543076.1 uridine phosphorylase [Candidatus Nanopelagicales bacterium]MCF8558246.1 uridine phosphorylase [Candidatus Nanopelagicales bacterium]
MKPENMNREFLDAVLAGEISDSFYHLGITSDDPMIEQLRDVTAVIMGGSGGRMRQFAEQWSAEHGNAPILAFPKEDRFVARYTAGVLFISHGMGMPSASIAMQELMRLLYFVKRGDLGALDSVFWARVGTSGGVGLPGGTIVVTTEGLMVDLKPYRLLDGGKGEIRFDGHYPQAIVDDILAANADSGIPMTSGKTVATNEFFIEQFRLDGAIRTASAERKMEWLRWLDENGVRNVEMEGAMIAAYLNHWGFSRFAMVCATLLNRLEGDQVHATPAEQREYNDRSGQVVFTYLRTIT